MIPAGSRASGGDAAEVQAAIERFLKESHRPALLEPGEPFLALTEGNFRLEFRQSRFVLQAWDENRNLVRRLLRIHEEARGKLTLIVEKFARREGELVLIDLARPQSREWQRRGSRMVSRERFRQFLTREFPDWKLTEISSEPNLEHTFSPAFPRALLTRGQSSWAAIGAGAEVEDGSGLLSFGLIWLDYLRCRDPRRTVEGLVIWMPEGKEKTTSLRLPFLNSGAAQFELFLYSEDDHAVKLDSRDYGNVDTHLERCPGGSAADARSRDAQFPEAWLEEQVRRDIETIDATLCPAPIYGQVPAFAAAERGIIDLLVLDRDGRLAVVELKASADIHLPLQALDYWMRVKRHLDTRDFTRRGYFPGTSLRGDPPRLLLVAPSLDFHPSSETILSYLSPEIEVVRIGVAANWREKLQVMFRLCGASRPD